MYNYNRATKCSYLLVILWQITHFHRSLPIKTSTAAYAFYWFSNIRVQFWRNLHKRLNRKKNLLPSSMISVIKLNSSVGHINHCQSTWQPCYCYDKKGLKYLSYFSLYFLSRLSNWCGNILSLMVDIWTKIVKIRTCFPGIAMYKPSYFQGQSHEIKIGYE